VFQFDPDSGGYAVLKTFTGLNGDPIGPAAALLLGSDNTLLGTTWQGGDFGFGTVYSLNRPPAMLPLKLALNKLEVRFSGLANQTYRVQRAFDVMGPWQTISTTTVNTNGFGKVEDPLTTNNHVFYRILSATK
jgi:uncharacterized repeat protein (TIGR03803 family)